MFDFTREEYERIKEKAMLNEELATILEMKIKGYSIPKIALELHISETTVSRRVNKLKKKIKRIIWQENDRKLRNQPPFFMAQCKWKERTRDCLKCSG